MQEADRSRFTAGIEKLALVLPDRRPDAEGMERLTRAYWTALGKMHIDVFERVVERAVETLERFPRPATLWNLAREVKRSAPPREEKPPVGDTYHAFGQRTMFQWLLRRIRQSGPLDAETLQRVIAMKNLEVDAYRALHQDGDPEATPERFVTRFEEGANRIVAMKVAA